MPPCLPAFTRKGSSPLFSSSAVVAQDENPKSRESPSFIDTVGNRWGTSQANVDSKEADQNALGPINACAL
ncbi:uncharacterized [Tachysurus ichikawai]